MRKLGRRYRVCVCVRELCSRYTVWVRELGNRLGGHSANISTKFTIMINYFDGHIFILSMLKYIPL